MAFFRTHYKEYLVVDKINKAKLDPITIYETVKIKLMLTRDGLQVPDKDVDGEEEDYDTYRERLIKVGVTTNFKEYVVRIDLSLIPT